VLFKDSSWPPNGHSWKKMLLSTGALASVDNENLSFDRLTRRPAGKE